MRWNYWLIAGMAGCSGLPTGPSRDTIPMQSTRLAIRESGPCLLNRSGEVVCWSPQGLALIPGSGALRFVTISGLSNLVCGLTADSAAYCWGAQNDFGEIGDGTRTPRESPSRVLGDVKFIAIKPQIAEVCALASTGRAYCWGDNHLGQLGTGEIGRDTGKLFPVPVKTSLRFREVEPTWGLDRDGRAWGWGDAGYLTAFWWPVHRVRGDCKDFYYWLFAGRGCLVPTPIKTPLRFATLTITESGQLYTFGDGWFGELGDGRIGDTFSPPIFAIEPVAVLGNIRFSVRSGLCALDLQGRAYCWGPNFLGQLGAGDYDSRPVPTAVASAQRFVEILSNGLTACGRSSADQVWCWGKGFGTMPVAVPFPLESSQARLQHLPGRVRTHSERS